MLPDDINIMNEFYLCVACGCTFTLEMKLVLCRAGFSTLVLIKEIEHGSFHN